MCKILLAEDESVIRAHIVQLIRTHMQPFAVTVEASSGLEAMAYLDKEEPDMMLTDIQMPGATGLQLIRYAKERYPELPCIVLTGYQEFQWAKEALQLGSLDYLLKPVSPNELMEALHRAVKTREKTETYASLYPLVELEPYFIKALDGDEDDIRDFAEKAEACLPFPEGGDPKVILAIDDVVSRQRLHEAVCKKKGIVFCASPHLLAAIVTVSSQLSQDRLREEIQGLADDLASGGGKPPAIGISGFFYSWEEAPAKYHEAFRYYAPRFYRGSGWIAGAMDAAHYAPKSSCLTAGADSGLEMDKLEDAFRSGAAEDVQRRIREWFRAAARDRWLITDVHTVCARLMRRLLGSFSHDQLELLGLQQWNAAQWVSKRRTAEGLECDLLEFVQRVVSRTQHYAGNVQSLVAKVQAVIERDYGVPELSIFQLAGELHVSSSHLSAVFKKKTGKPFTQYVADWRLDKARQLLSEDRLKAYEVAAAVGYRNEKAFSRAFRRKFGVSPQNYKKQSGLR